MSWDGPHPLGADQLRSPAVVDVSPELPYTPARLQWPRSAQALVPSLIVIHDMEAPEGPLTAENCARYFQSLQAQGSAHLCADTNSVVRSVHDGFQAAGARGFPYRGKTINDWALHIELCGYARQTRAEWLDVSSVDTMKQAAPHVARWAMAYEIPAFRLSDDQLRAGRAGICGHGDVSRALGVASGHTDPGAGFPWDVFLPLVINLMEDEVWTDAEKAKLLQGADASIKLEARWDASARKKLDDVWTQLVDRNATDPAAGGTVGGMTKAVHEATVPEDS